MTQAEKLQIIAENELKVHEAGYKKGKAECSASLDAIIDGSITSISSDTLTKVGWSALTNRMALVSVDFPNVTAVDEYAFYYCELLASVNLPNCRELIGEMNFAYCISLESIDLPNVESIGYYTFEGCENLRSVTIRTPFVCTLLGSGLFVDTPIGKGDGYIYVPADLVDSYKSATNWSRYVNQIRAIQ